MGIINYIVDKASSGLMPFLFFLGGTVIGFIIISSVYFFLCKKKSKENEDICVKDVSKIIADGKTSFSSSNTGLDLNAKITATTNALIDAVKEIDALYFLDDDKKYKIIGNTKYSNEGLYLTLDFTVYEILGFLSGVFSTVQKELEKSLNSKNFERAYFAYRLINNKIDKNVYDLKISTIIDVVSTPKEEIEKSKVSAFFGTLIKTALSPVIKLGITVVKPTVVSTIDDLFSRLIEGVLQDVNLLYAHGFGQEFVLLDETKEGEENAF